MSTHKSYWIVLLLIMITSCKPLPIVQYHSLADVEFETRQTFTELKVMKGLDGYESKRKYIVLAGIDNNTDKYVLIAPKKEASQPNRGTNFTNFVMSSSVPLQSDRAAAWLDDLRIIHENWGRLDEQSDGSVYEFIQRPVTYETDSHKYLGRYIFKFSSHKSSIGAGASLLFGVTDWSHIVRLDNIEDIEDLILMLDNALKIVEV